MRIHPSAWVEIIPASGQASASMQEMLAEVREHYLRPISRGQRINELWDALKKVETECANSDWDSYGAEPLSPSAVNELKILLGALPLHAATPDIFPEPSGGIGLEWRRGNDAILLLKLSGDGSVAYSSIVGTGVKTYGVEKFSGKLPALVEEKYLPYFGEASS